MPKKIEITSNKYKTKYKLDIKYGNFSKEEIKKEGLGGCDALVFFSIIFPEDSSYSQTFFSFDGRNEGKELSSNDLFKVWSLMSKNLCDRTDLMGWKKELVEITFNTVKKKILGKRGVCN